jgi:hypothetical protein
MNLGLLLLDKVVGSDFLSKTALELFDDILVCAEVKYTFSNIKHMLFAKVISATL